MPAALTCRHAGSHNTTRPALSNCRQGGIIIAAALYVPLYPRRTAAMGSRVALPQPRASEREQVGTARSSFASHFTHVDAAHTPGQRHRARSGSAANARGAPPAVRPLVRTEGDALPTRRGALPRRRFSGAPSSRILCCYCTPYLSPRYRPRAGSQSRRSSQRIAALEAQCSWWNKLGATATPT